MKIAKCNSKVVLCGVGKSGLIASKIAATLSSTGCPAFSLSAGDSSHGDLGSISKKDILILISYSGQTNELKNIIQYAKRNKILFSSQQQFIKTGGIYFIYISFLFILTSSLLIDWCITSSFSDLW